MFLVICQEMPVCPKCGKPLVLRDHRRRIHRLAGGKKEWYMIPRMECINKECPCKIHSCIPDNMSPHKHYDAGLIEDVIDGVLSSDDIGTEDYPCADTMALWKEWAEKNTTNIDGQIRSIGYRLLDFGIQILTSAVSIIQELRQKISTGWLKAVTWVIYNTGGRITPVARLP